MSQPEVIGATGGAAAERLSVRCPKGFVMNIEAYEFTGEKLMSMPKNTRILFIQLAHLTNCISILHKLLVYTFKKSDNEVESHSFVSQGSLVARNLAGVISEGWEVLRKSFFGTKLSKKYEPMLTEEGKEAFASLKSYFSNDNPITLVRNKFAFHFGRDVIEDYLPDIDNDRIYHIYLSEHQGNSLFYVAEEIVGMSMTHAVAKFLGVEDLLEANKTLYMDLVHVSRWYLRFIHECLAFMTRDYLGDSGKFVTKTVEVGGDERMDEVVVPYFVHPPMNKDT